MSFYGERFLLHFFDYYHKKKLKSNKLVKLVTFREVKIMSHNACVNFFLSVTISEGGVRSSRNFCLDTCLHLIYLLDYSKASCSNQFEETSK